MGYSLRGLSLLCCALFLAGCATGVKDTSRSFHTVIIDAGHGGKDSGAVSNHLREKDLTLDVALRLEPELRQAGFHTVMTRRGDYFVELNDRADISNRQENAFFISIHFNQTGSRRFHGAQVYFHSTPSARLAAAIVNSLGAIIQNNGTHFASFRVLRNNHFPAVLVECAFISNRGDAGKAASPAFRQQIADRIAQAIIGQRLGK